MENTTTSLGDEVTSSMNKTEKSMDAAGQAISNGAQTVGNVVEDGMDWVMNGNDNTEENTRTDNRAVAGTTGNYTTSQIGQQTDTTSSSSGITGNAWIWIVMVVAALVIVASVWLYASQRD